MSLPKVVFYEFYGEAKEEKGPGLWIQQLLGKRPVAMEPAIQLQSAVTTK